MPRSPFGRYQAFYTAGLGLFVLFGFLWGLLARRPAPVVQQVIAAPPKPIEPEDGVVSPPRRAPRMPSPLDEVPGEPPASRSAPPRPRRSIESLDPEMAPREEAKVPLREEAALAPGEETPPTPPEAESAVWGTPQESASPLAAVASVPDWEMPAAPPANGSSAEGRGEFSFGELDPAMAPAAEGGPASNGTAPELGQAAEPFPEPPRGEESWPPPAPEQIPEQPESSVTMQDFSMPGADSDDPDEPHWRETYDRFVELKVQLGEPADRISFEKFAAKLKKNRADLVAKHNCKGVRFSVYEKDGKAAIKASAIR